MLIALVSNIFSSVRSGICCLQHIPLLTELGPIDEQQTIKMSLLRSYETTSANVDLARFYVFAGVAI
jgi:hypothetical protein